MQGRQRLYWRLISHTGENPGTERPRAEGNLKTLELGRIHESGHVVPTMAQSSSKKIGAPPFGSALPLLAGASLKRRRNSAAN